MIYYLQRERNLQAAIPSNGILQFDTPVALNATNSSQPTEALQYQEDGSIDIVSPGTYAVFWFVTGMTGFATDGQSYGLKRRDYSEETPAWQLLAKSTNQIKNSSTPGFSLIEVSDEEINEYEKATIALFNTADNAAELTFFSPKAGILVFGLDLDALENRLDGIDQEIGDLFLQLQSIEDFVRLSAVTEVWSLSPDLSGLGVAVINSGYTYNFWGIGTLNHQQTLNSGETYYLIESSQFQPLTLYQGSSTIGTLWIETPASSVYSIPVRFDGSGIYFTPSTTISNLPVGTTFKFTQALILV